MTTNTAAMAMTAINSQWDSGRSADRNLRTQPSALNHQTAAVVIAKTPMVIRK
jgi:hypothetical protein